jgi:hypothetical protein
VFSAVNAQGSDSSSRFLQFGAAKTCLGLTQKPGFSTKEDRFSHQQEYTNPETGNFFVESVLVISIADSDFVQAFSQQVNKLLITNCP